MNPYIEQIKQGIQPPTMRDLKRTKLDALIECANTMQVGDSIMLSNSEAQIMRYILAAQGFIALTDGWRSPDRTKTLVFKLSR